MNKQFEEVDGMLVVDIDGTLCGIKAADQSYAELIPNQPMLEKLREYQEAGYRILLFTSET